MHIPTSFWVCTVAVLAVHSLGIVACLTLPVIIAAFIAGILSVNSLRNWNETNELCKKMQSGNVQFKKAFLSQVVESMHEDEQKQNAPPPVLDKRLTGSREIDTPLQEVLNYIFHDYLNTWYSEVSDDPDFIFNVQKSTQETIVHLVNRMKDVDWMPFLTTTLVDDAASHLRLYRQAKAKMKEEETINDSPAKKSNQLLKHFFDFELAMEKKELCRDAVCLDKDNSNLSQYLKDISEILLFLLLPEADFKCHPIRMLLRDILAHSALMPLFELLSEPDFINQTIVSLAELRQLPFTSDMLLNVLRTTDSVGELQGISEMLNKDIALLRSCDLGLEDDRKIKQQLSSLIYTKKIIDSRLLKLQEGSENDSTGLPSYMEWKQNTGTGPLIALPLDELLRNNIALFYFIDFMMSIGAQAYLYFYLNVEGWRATAEQQLAELHMQRIKDLQRQQEAILDNKGITEMQLGDTVSNMDVTKQTHMVENLREAAKSICEQYLSEKASPRLKINDVYYNRLIDRINNDFPNETWFDEIQSLVYDILKRDDRFLPAFRQSCSYMKLLVELDLLKDPGRSDDEEGHYPDIGSQNSKEQSGVFDIEYPPHFSDISAPTEEPTQLGMLPPYTYKADITETGVANDHGNKYGIYCISVIKHSETTGLDESWQICRRYSDFLSIHQKIKDRHEDLGKLPFPSKRAFNSTERSTLEKRMIELNGWLQLILSQLGPLGPGVEQRYPELCAWIQTFLQHGDYEQQGTRQFAKTVEQYFVKPLKSSLRSMGNVVRSVPETMSKAIHGLSTRQPNPFEASKVGASLDVETSDNIPLRIMLLLLDEVFDLKSRNQWLRRRIVNIVRQIVKSMFGDIVNRRILDYVSWLTSPMQVATYIEFFRDTFWPDGVRATSGTARSDSDKMRTRVLAKMALLASMTDEIKRIMGTETTRRGLLLVFEVFQQPKLNRRLALVLFEEIVITLFPDHDIKEIFKKLHSGSERTQTSQW